MPAAPSLRSRRRVWRTRWVTVDHTGPVTVDTAARRAYLGEEELSLTHREFDLLAYLVSHAGKAYTKAELLRRVWGWDFGDSSTVTVHVRRLREKIEADPSDPKLVLTVPRTGYLFAGDA